MNDTPKLGQLLDETAQRDAFHVAVAPVVAAEKLWPSMEVALNAEGKAHNTNAPAYIGIVDPFLSRAVMPGDRFYLWLKPNTVTGMRHHWQHPAFGEPTPKPVDNGVSP